MEQEKDFLEREIQRLSLVLKTLTDRVLKIEPEGNDSDFEDVNNSLKEEFGFSIESFGELEQPDLIIKIKEFHHFQIDELAELLYLMVKSPNAKWKTQGSKIKSINNITFLIEYLNQHSTTFSLDRMRLESSLRLLKETID
jgi:hypothetical protein